MGQGATAAPRSRASTEAREGEPRTPLRAVLADGGGNSQLVDGVRRAMAALGVQLQSEPTAPAQVAARVLVFDAVDAEVCATVRWCAGGDRRVLAIGASREALRGDGAWALLAAGATDVLPWRPERTPYDVRDRLLRWQVVDALVEHAGAQLIGDSTALRRVLRQVVEVARFTSAPVLITGESGTGKELLARTVHEFHPPSAHGSFVLVDCTTIVPELSGSEFFGHERGAYTGAVSARDGAFALADSGTLFLDEIGELPPRLQAELLRVVQEGTYKRVGGNTWRRTRFRLVCATNRDLREECRRGRFREDLYYRIAAWTCTVPSLSDRRHDIVPLARHFLAQLSEGEPPELESAVQQYLTRRDYPGNVRDLRQLVMRIRTRHAGTGPISLGDIPEDDRPTAAGRAGPDGIEDELHRFVRAALDEGATLKEIKDLAATTAVTMAIAREAGRIKDAAQRLGVTERTLQLRRASLRRDCEAFEPVAAGDGDGRCGSGSSPRSRTPVRSPEPADGSAAVSPTGVARGG